MLSRKWETCPKFHLVPLLWIFYFAHIFWLEWINLCSFTATLLFSDIGKYSTQPFCCQNSQSIEERSIFFGGFNSKLMQSILSASECDAIRSFRFTDLAFLSMWCWCQWDYATESNTAVIDAVIYFSPGLLQNPLDFPTSIWCLNA